jgi:hypothetical protein
VKVLLQSVIGSGLSNMNQSELGALLGPSLYSQSSFRDGSRQRELGDQAKGHGVDGKASPKVEYE